MSKKVHEISEQNLLVDVMSALEQDYVTALGHDDIEQAKRFMKDSLWYASMVYFGWDNEDYENALAEYLGAIDKVFQNVNSILAKE